jgi:hypothetical protein
MGSQKPIIGAYKPDLVAVILDRYCAQQLALALAWALGTTGGGKMKTKGGYRVVLKGEGGKEPVKTEPPKKEKPSDDSGAKAGAQMASSLKIVDSPGSGGETKKRSSKKSSAKKSESKKSGKK